MASKKSKPSFIPTPWHAAMWLLLSACLVLVVAIWYSGGREAANALEAGRRMVITISTGEIQGKRMGSPKAAADGLSPDAHADDAVLASAEALAAVNPSLQDQTEYGVVPAIGPDGTKPWRYYSRPFQHRGGLPMVALIVGGLGQNQSVGDAALRLPADITLSFSPYAPDVDKWAVAARASGHEMMLDVPLQPNDYPATDPGPLGLLTTEPNDENEKTLQKLMARAQGHIGFLAPYSENFSDNNEMFKLMLQEINNHGLMMVVAQEPHKTETREIIDASNTPAVISDVWVDEDPSEAGITERLATLEQIAKKRGYSIGIAHGLPITLDQLRKWSADLASKGIVLVPVTFIAKPRFS